ncbi:MAG: apolipoprotein N-acyltransferase [Leptolyngbya sp. RL_3_1]|nr:apolipoprotein N-acyltransferase [Leptolyngbya sp. RL_3_1]
MAVVLGGLLMGLTPAPVNAWPLAWVALAPLWAVLLSQRWRLGQAFRLGWLWSAVYHGIALAWITALHPLMWMGIPWLGSIAIALFAWSFITLLGAVTFGLWAMGIAYIAPRWPAPITVLSGTALWCGLETLLSWGPLYWPSLSYTQSPGNLWILHLGQLSGPMTIAAAIVAVNGCWAVGWWAWRRRFYLPGQGGLRQGEGPFAPTASRFGIALLVGLHLLGYGLAATGASDNTGNPLRIGLIQGNVPTRVKLTPTGTRQALQGYTQGYRDLVAQGAEAVLTPEGAIPEVWSRASQTRSPIYQAVQENGVVLWLGTFRRTLDGAHLTQSLVTLDRNGQVFSQYNKVKLVPLGEYIPFQPVLGRVISRLSPLEGSLAPGSTQQLMETPFGPAIVGICYESPYSELFRRQAAKGGEWIMTASNNDPYPPRMMAQHHAHDVMRAVESDRWAVRVTNTGLSGIVTPHGRTQWLSEPNQYATHLTTIYRRQSQMLYVRWGDWLTPSLGLITVAMLGFLKTHPRGRLP